MSYTKEVGPKMRRHYPRKEKKHQKVTKSLEYKLLRNIVFVLVNDFNKYSEIMKSSLARLETAGLLLCVIFSAALFAGCDYFRIPSEVRKSLKAAGDNKDELLAVIDHFRHDSEKLQAAYYLIANMPGHYSVEGNNVFDPAFDQIKPILDKTGLTPESGEIFTAFIDSIRQINPPSLSLREDIKTISSDYLIQNIDLAFEAYHSIPDNLRCDKDTFFKFVLPYRDFNETLEQDLRSYFYEKYNWIFERMDEYGSLQPAICDLLDSLNIIRDQSYKYPALIPLSNIYRLGVGNSCDDMVNLVIFIFRALGMPAASDNSFFGNGIRTGHSWIVFLLEDSVYAVDLSTRQIMNTLYYYESLPKVYRRQFERNERTFFTDVTSNYRNTIDIHLHIEDGCTKEVHLQLFHKEEGWRTVDRSIQNRGEITFNDVGKSLVYVISEVSDNEFQVINYPFYVNENGVITDLIPDHENPITAYITRKFAPWLLRLLDEINWVNSINGAKIQASDKADFSDAVTLFKIKNFKSSNKQIINTGNKEKYRNYRLVSADSSEIHLAGFNLMKDGKIIMIDWQVFSSKDQNIHPEGYKLTDNEPLSFISDKYLTVNYYFNEPVAVNEFQIQARNRDNGVKPGCRYELMYWDKRWISAGVKYSTDTLLIYDNIPSGALYWLRNHTEGIMEQVFLLDSAGYQYWPGVTAFNDSYHEFLELERFCPNRSF